MSRSIVAILLAGGLLPAAFAPRPALAVDYSNCSVYGAPQRYFLDSQGWWTRTPGQNGSDFGHVHTTTCFPVQGTVSGRVPFDVRLTMHNNPGRLTTLTLQIFGSYGAVVVARKTFSPALTCATTCDWWVHLDADTTLVPKDGWQEFRFRPKIDEPDGNQLVGSTSWQAYLNNGKPRNDYRPATFMQGKGWYTGFDYAQARFTAGFPFNPVAGTWTPTVGCDATQLAVTHCLVTIDPDFHAGNNGLIQLERNGPFAGNVSIDTTRLSNGAHKLVIRSDAATPSTIGSTLGGVLGIPFTVANN